MANLSRLIGTTITLRPDDREVEVVAVGDYEPGDYSVGILTGYVTVTCNDGNEYDIADNGDVYLEGESSSKPHGYAAPLWEGMEDSRC